jgi:hypothetical protein
MAPPPAGSDPAGAPAAASLFGACLERILSRRAAPGVADGPVPNPAPCQSNISGFDSAPGCGIAREKLGVRSAVPSDIYINE